MHMMSCIVIIDMYIYVYIYIYTHDCVNIHVIELFHKR